MLCFLSGFVYSNTSVSYNRVIGVSHLLDYEKIACIQARLLDDNIRIPSPNYELFDYIASGDPQGLSELFNTERFKLDIIKVYDYRRSLTETMAVCHYAASRAGLLPLDGMAIYVYYLDISGQISREEDLLSLIPEVMLDYARAVKDMKSTAAYSPPISACVEYINKHIYEKISPATLSGIAHYSLSTLRSRFKKEVGCSLNKYIICCKIKKAEHFLTYSSVNGTQLAHFLGFCSQSYFIEQFKTLTGKTPEAYRAHQQTLRNKG